jgi:uncharacterized membrane-anchored protein YitT (DUF2179 family)
MTKNRKDISFSRIALALLGSAVLAFGLFNIHSISDISEGGALGLTLLGEHWLSLSPAVTSIIINGICYFIGAKTLGRSFIVYSVVSGGGFSIFYAIFERIGHIYPDISNYPLAASVLGALFVGVGAGLCVKAGGAPTGDDALAMSLSKIFKLRIEYVYLVSDITVLALSLTYIPLNKILYSLLTVVLSGQVIGIIDRIGKKKSSD